MITEIENDRLTRVGPDTPMGNLQRHYWIPVACAYEVGAPGSAPLPVRLLGEDLVCFRNTEGVLGLLGAYCPHRRAPLQLGRNCDGVLQCLYHGWKMRVDGSVAETPNEPEESTLAQRVQHISYPVIERAGLIWAYMGDPATVPPFREFEWMSLPSEQVVIMKGIVQCNWLQLIEGFVDSSHGNFLHRDWLPASTSEKAEASSSDEEVVLSQPTDSGRIRIRIEDTEYGFRYAAIRRPTVDPDRLEFIRSTPFIMPIYTSIPVGEGFGVINITVPIDDLNVAHYAVRYAHHETLDDEFVRRQNGFIWDVDIDRQHRRIPTEANGWQQDRIAMESGRSFSGLGKPFNEDSSMAEGMGRISDRTNERLGAADRAIVHMRRMLLQAMEDCEAGRPALGEDVADVSDVRAADGLIPINGDWREPVARVHSRV